MLNQVAESYLGILELATAMSHTKSPNAAERAQRIWRGLREARIYDVPQWVQEDAGVLVSECRRDPERVLPCLELPFNSMFIGANLQITGGTNILLSEDYATATLCGYLVVSDGDVWAFVRVETQDGETGIVPLELSPPGSPSSNGTFLYSMVALLTKAITHHTTQVLRDMPEFGKEMRKYKKLLGMAKIALPVPPPFYEIVVKDIDLKSVLREGTMKSAPAAKGWELAHQVEVAGHVKYKLMRGDLPVRAERLTWLAKNKYQLFEGGMHGAEPEILDGLARRGVWHPGPAEWLAVKVTKVASYTKGPEDGLLIPAVRVIK